MIRCLVVLNIRQHARTVTSLFCLFKSVDASNVGHRAIGTVTVIIEHGLVISQTAKVLRLDTPAGIVEAFYTMEGEFVDNVRIRNIASYLYAKIWK